MSGILSTQVLHLKIGRTAEKFTFQWKSVGLLLILGVYYFLQFDDFAGIKGVQKKWKLHS